MGEQAGIGIIGGTGLYQMDGFTDGGHLSWSRWSTDTEEEAVGAEWGV